MYRNSVSSFFAEVRSTGAILPVTSAPQRSASNVTDLRPFHLCTLGRFRLYYGLTEIAAPRTANARAVLTCCVARAGQDVARERLLELFWSDADVNQARGSLKTALWLIRASIRTVLPGADDYLFTNKSVVRWDGPVSLDRDLFIEAAACCDIESMRAAFALYTGDFLEGDYGQWADEERSRIADIYEKLLVRLLRAAPSQEVAERLLERDPYCETAYRFLIEDRLAVGCLRSATRYAERCITALAEIGARPSAGFPLVSHQGLRSVRAL